jgi:hypothetical protein
MSIRRARFIVRAQPRRNDAISMASHALRNGAINSTEAQQVERIAQGIGIYPPQLLHKIRNGSR